MRDEQWEVSRAVVERCWPISGRGREGNAKACEREWALAIFGFSDNNTYVEDWMGFLL